MNIEQIEEQFRKWRELCLPPQRIRVEVGRHTGFAAATLKAAQQRGYRVEELSAEVYEIHDRVALPLARVCLPSGGEAIYEVPDTAWSPLRVRELGRQVAHQLNGTWYRAGGWTRLSEGEGTWLLEHALGAEEQPVGASA
jgi:hypothetical protein